MLKIKPTGQIRFAVLNFLLGQNNLTGSSSFALFLICGKFYLMEYLFYPGLCKLSRHLRQRREKGISVLKLQIMILIKGRRSFSTLGLKINYQMIFIP